MYTALDVFVLINLLRKKKREVKFIKIYLKTISIKSFFGGNKKG